MSEFTTSQLSPEGNPQRKKGAYASGIRNNTLVVVVTKAHGLRNVLKMDKQSPFITIRIQDQEESTKVVSRGGQTPTFNDELWFNLDGIEERTLYINAYHQKKNDAKLICCGEVDYSTALKRSTSEGFDGWFTLYWEGREAGKVYLEMTYYPKKGEVPIGTQSAGRMQMSKKEKLSVGSDSQLFGNSLRGKSQKLRKSEVDNLPELGELNIEESSSGMGKINNKFSNFEKRYNSSRSPSQSPVQTPKNSPSKYDLQKSNSITFKGNTDDESSSTPAATNTVGNWFSFLDNTLKFPSILNNITFNTNNSSHGDVEKKDINDELDGRVKLKVESPELIQERPKKLFDTDDENDDDYDLASSVSPGLVNMRDINVTDQWKKSIASRQEAIYKEKGLTVSSLSFKNNDSKNKYEPDSSESEGEYTLGQVVDFRSSSKSGRNKVPNRKSPQKERLARLDDDEMRKSYQGRRLPDLKGVDRTDLFENNHDDDDDEEDDDIPPPPPPKHIISMSSLFDSNLDSSSSSEKFVLHNTASELPKTAGDVPSLGNNEKGESDSRRPLSWYERRKMERRRHR